MFVDGKVIKLFNGYYSDEALFDGHKWIGKHCTAVGVDSDSEAGMDVDSGE